MEEQKHLFKNPNHLTNLNSMRLSGQFCDVTIKVNGKELRAHKNILAANLKYFQSIFQEIEQDNIIMKDLEETDLETFICYAYTGEILLTDVNALGLLKVANHLNENVIKNTCINFLEKNLKTKDACRTYQFANSIDCLSLKNIAKTRILSNFGYCSRTNEYFDFDCESLKEIFCDADLTTESQQNLFEGLMRWILHDLKSRQIHIKYLLSIIDLTKLAASYLIEYLAENFRDQGNIVKDIMFLYHDKMRELESLIVIGGASKKLQIQYYDFTENKWSQLREVIYWDESHTEGWAISNNKFYYTFSKGMTSEGNSKTCLEVFNLSDKRSTRLASDGKLLRYSTLCACSRFLYLCGGWKEDCSYSDQVLRYDSLTNYLETLAPMGTKRYNAASIFYRGSLLVLGGSDGENDLNSVEKYDPKTKRWMAFPSMWEERVRHAVAVLDGKLYACGGAETKSVEVYDPDTDSWQYVESMNENRYQFLAVALEGKLLSIGGDEKKTVEVYDPSTDEWKIDDNLSSGLQKGCIFGGGLISSSYANRHTT